MQKAHSLRLLFALRRDVARQLNEAAQRAMFVPDSLNRNLRQESASVLAHKPYLGDLLAMLTCNLEKSGGLAGGDRIRGEEHPEVAANHLLPRVPLEVLCRDVPDLHVAV